MAQDRRVQSRNGNVRRGSLSVDGLDLRDEEAARLEAIRRGWENKDSRWAVDPVFAFCVAALARADADTKRLGDAAARLLKAREKARGPIMRLDASMRNFGLVLRNARNGLRLVTDDEELSPYAEVVGYSTEAIRDRVTESLDADLVGVVTKKGPYRCPMCGHREG